MEKRVGLCVQKVERLLAEILKGQCHKDIEENLTILITIFEQQLEKGLESMVVLRPILTGWLKGAVIKWNSLRITPTTKICVFVLNLASLLSKNQESFCLLNRKKFFARLLNILKARQVTAAACVKSAYIKLLSSFLDHDSGIQFMITSDFWEDIYQMSLSKVDDQIVRESTDFVSKLLEKTIDVDESFTDDAVKRLMLPLGEDIYNSIKESNDQDVANEVTSKYLKPSLKLIGNILEYFLNKVLRAEKDFAVLIIFYQNFHLKARISDFILIVQSKSLAFDLGRIMLMMQFFELYVKIMTNTTSVANVNATIRKIKNNFLLSISRGSFEETLAYCNFGQLYWRVLEKHIPSLSINKDDNFENFSNELVLFEVLPFFCISMVYCYEKSDFEGVFLEDFREGFILKLFNMSCTDVIRKCYHWRDVLLPRDDLFEICMQCNKKLEESYNYITRDGAVIVVQTWIYNFKDVVRFTKEYPKKLEYFLNELTYLGKILQLLDFYIDKFEVTWKDSIESIDLLSTIFDFLLLYSWPPNIITLTLKLVKTAINRYMAPNLALLLENTSDSALTVFGPLLFSKLLGADGGVKIAALEVVRTLAGISNSSK